MAERTPMREGFAALALHRPSRPENIGGVFRTADVYGVKLVVLGGGELPPEPLGHPTDTTQAWRRTPVAFADEVLDALPEECVPVAIERVSDAPLLPEFEHSESAAYIFGSAVERVSPSSRPQGRHCGMSRPRQMSTFRLRVCRVAICASASV